MSRGMWTCSCGFLLLPRLSSADGLYQSTKVVRLDGRQLRSSEERIGGDSEETDNFVRASGPRQAFLLRVVRPRSSNFTRPRSLCIDVFVQNLPSTPLTSGVTLSGCFSAADVLVYVSCCVDCTRPDACGPAVALVTAVRALQPKAPDPATDGFLRILMRRDDVRVRRRAAMCCTEQSERPQLADPRWTAFQAAVRAMLVTCGFVVASGNGR